MMNTPIANPVVSDVAFGLLNLLIPLTSGVYLSIAWYYDNMQQKIFTEHQQKLRDMNFSLVENNTATQELMKNWEYIMNSIPLNNNFIIYSLWILIVIYTFLLSVLTLIQAKIIYIQLPTYLFLSVCTVGLSIVSILLSINFIRMIIQRQHFLKTFQTLQTFEIINSALINAQNKNDSI